MQPGRLYPRRTFLKLAAGTSLAAALPGGLIGPSRATSTALDLTPADMLDGLYAGLNLYWGDIHGHCGFSDGVGTPRQYFEFARTQRLLDFAAVTDHAEWMNYMSERLRMADGSPVPLWPMTVAEARAQNRTGSFVALPAYEWTSTPFGHRCIIFRDPTDVPASLPSAYTHKTPEELWEALAPHMAMTIPHHTMRWECLMDWSRINPETDRLVEVYSKWGNSFTGYTTYEPLTVYRQYENRREAAHQHSVEHMLSLGHRIGLIAGTDTHQGLPGSSSVSRPRGTVLPKAFYPRTGEDLLFYLENGFTYDHREPRGGGGGLAAVWSPALSREAIWDALYRRNTYGTSGIRPIVRFGVLDTQNMSSGAIMGDDFDTSGPPTFYVSVVPVAGSRVTRMDLVRDNVPIKIWLNPANGAAFSHTDEQLPVGQTSQYSCRMILEQAGDANHDGDRVLVYNAALGRLIQGDPELSERIWTSPIWVSRAVQPA